MSRYRLRTRCEISFVGVGRGQGGVKDGQVRL